jgi:hypothetical protein
MHEKQAVPLLTQDGPSLLPGGNEPRLWASGGVLPHDGSRHGPGVGHGYGMGTTLPPSPPHTHTLARTLLWLTCGISSWILSLGSLRHLEPHTSDFDI